MFLAALASERLIYYLDDGRFYPVRLPKVKYRCTPASN